MATYIELQEQIKALQAKAEAQKLEELPAVIDEIKKKIVQYGIKVDQLFDEPGLSDSKRQNTDSQSTKELLPMKYRCDGVEWSGRGKMPKVFAAAIEKAKDEGQTITKEHFLIKDNE